MAVTGSRIDQFSSGTINGQELFLFERTNNSSYYSGAISAIANLASTLPGAVAGSVYAGDNVTLSTNGASTTVSVTGLQSSGAYLTTAMQSNASTGFMLTGERNNYFYTSNNTFANSTHSHGNPTLALTNLSGTTASNSAGLTLSLSAAAGGGGADGYNILAAGTQTANTTGTVNFANSNGITFGMSGSSQITASHNGLTTQTVQTQNLMTVNGTQGNVTISGGNGVTVGNNASTVTISVATNYQSQGAYLTTAAASNHSHAFSAAGGSSNFQTLSFADTNGVSFTNTNGSIGATVRTNYASSDHSHGNPTLNLTNLSGTTASNSAGLTLSLSASQSNQALSAGNGSFSFQTASFSNANGISFSTSAGSAIVASHNGLTTAMASNQGTDFVQANAAFAGTNASGTIASNGISVSVAAPGAAAENNWFELAGNTAGNSTASGSTIQLIGGDNITLSGANGSQIQIVGGGGGGGQTLSYYNPQDAYLQVTGQQGQGTLHIQPMQAPSVQFDRLMMPIVNTNSSNSSGSHTLSFWAGIYTRNVSTLSMLYSASTSTAVTHSGTAGSYSLMSGMRLLSMGFTQTLTGGQYWVGILSRTTSGGTNGSYSQMLASQVNSSFFGHFGSAVNATMQYTRGLGTYSATTNAIPSSIGFSQINGASNSLVLRQPIFYLVSGTV